MEVISKRSALLSNYEVLALLKELESEQLARQKTAIRIKKEEEERISLGLVDGATSSLTHTFAQKEVCENLRTIEFEAIQYLNADYLPTKQQSAESINQLVRGLIRFDLTKAEKLQIINLAPTEPVELYAIVEEIEDRFGDTMDDVLDVVRSSITKPLFLPIEEEEEDSSIQVVGADVHEPRLARGETEDEGGPPEELFDDTGAGAGVEGDLEMGDDNEE